MADKRLPIETIVLDRISSDPLRIQLYECLRRLIQKGGLPGESVLPSSRELAAHLRIGRNTVIAAYDQLAAEGYLRNRPGARSTTINFLASRAPPTARPNGLARMSARGRLMSTQPFHYDEAGQAAFHPGMPDADHFPFALLSRLIANRAKFARRGLFGSSHTAGHPAFRAAIAAYLTAARGVNCSEDQIVVTTGAIAALDLIARMFLDRGDAVWMEEPGYHVAQAAFLAAGGVLRPLNVDMDGWRLDTEPQSPVRLIYITPSCQHPLGMTMGVEQRLRLLEIAQRHSAFVVEDDYDGEYRFGSRPIPSLQGLDRFGNVIYVGTFAKILFPALRVGFMVVPPGLAPLIARALGASGQFPPLLLQAALSDFIEQGHLARHLRRMRRIYAQRRQFFLEFCEAELGERLLLSQGDAGIQIAGLLAGRHRDLDVCDDARRLGVNVSPLSVQYRHGSARHGLLLGYAACDEPTTRQGLRLLGAALRASETRKN